MALMIRARWTRLTDSVREATIRLMASFSSVAKALNRIRFGIYSSHFLWQDYILIINRENHLESLSQDFANSFHERGFTTKR